MEEEFMPQAASIASDLRIPLITSSWKRILKESALSDSCFFKNTHSVNTCFPLPSEYLTEWNLCVPQCCCVRSHWTEFILCKSSL